MLVACWLLALAAQEGADGPAALRARWRELTPPEKREALEWFSAEVDGLGGTRARLRQLVLPGSAELVAGALPHEPPPWFEPDRHAPAQPIPRRRLTPGDPALEGLRERFLRNVPERGLAPAFVYDAARGALVRLADPEDPERVFESALAGYGPRDDLVEALVLRALDDGTQREALAAFGHVYTDRDGRAYGELTLYDAWASGSEIEMPDVDALGILHDVLDDWKSFKAPVPASRQKKLYQRIGELFVPAHRYLGLRRALAWTYLAGSPALRDGYAFQLDLLHALWNEVEDRPEALLERLPDDRRWEDFFEREGRRLDREPELRAQAQARRARLEGEAQAVRAAIGRVVAGLIEQRAAAPAIGGDERR